jgi:hypothetical protein
MGKKSVSVKLLGQSVSFLNLRDFINGFEIAVE